MTLLLVTGPPGAGKSTVARYAVRAWTPAALVAGDVFFGFWRRGYVMPWLPEAHDQNVVVTRAAGAAAGAFVAGGCPVVYDGVVGPWLLDDFAAAAGLDELHYAVLLPPLEVCLDRVATRTGHGFTDAAATARMHAEFADAEVDPRHLLTDLPDRPRDVAQLVLERYRSGALAHRTGRGASGQETVPPVRQ